MNFTAMQSAQVRRAAAQEDKRSFRAVVEAVLRTLAAAALSAALGAGCFYGYRWASNAPAFAIRDIRFTGLVHATEAELVARSGMKAGDNLFRADLLQAARGIEGHPWVAAARLTRKLPGTIEVSVLEHHPAALVQMGGLYVLDEQGKLFKRAAPQDALDLPIISGLSREEEPALPATGGARRRGALEEPALPATGGARRRGALEEPGRELRLLHALHFLDTWQTAGFAVSDLSELRLEDDAGVTLFARDGDGVQEVRLGSSDWPLKLRRLSSMRAALARRNEHAAKINLDNPARPAEAAATLAEKR
jgi:cell division protein FtsQ